jgi:ribosomal protein S18 acetylase RimI-like enzyme
MEWRNARTDDLAILVPWIRDTRQCLLWAGNKVRFPLQVPRLADEIEFTPANAWCLCDNGAMIGFGQILRRAPARAHFARLIVTPDLRGHGYGTALCKKMLETAMQWPAYEIATLNVFRSNLVAQSLYTRMGFYPVGLAQSERRDPNVLLMVRALHNDYEPYPRCDADGRHAESHDQRPHRD